MGGRKNEKEAPSQAAKKSESEKSYISFNE
jgi:hypothetical protein